MPNNEPSWLPLPPAQVGDSLEEFLVSATNDAKLRQLMMSMSEAIRTIAFKVSSVPGKEGCRWCCTPNGPYTMTALHAVRTPCHVPVGMPAPSAICNMTCDVAAA